MPSDFDSEYNQFFQRISAKPDSVELRQEFSKWLEEYDSPLTSYLKRNLESVASEPPPSANSLLGGKRRKDSPDSDLSATVDTDELERLFPGLKRALNWRFAYGTPVALHPPGLFRARGELRYLRFSRDNRMIELTQPRVRESHDQLRVNSVAPDATANPIDFNYLHRFRYLAYGSYRIVPRTDELGIQFETYSAAGRVQYEGRVVGDHIETSWRSEINKSTGNETFECVPFEDPSVAAELPQRYVKAIMDELNGPTDLKAERSWPSNLIIGVGDRA